MPVGVPSSALHGKKSMVLSRLNINISDKIRLEVHSIGTPNARQ